jgi:hypothetical protein
MLSGTSGAICIPHREVKTRKKEAIYNQINFRMYSVTFCLDYPNSVKAHGIAFNTVLFGVVSIGST